MYQFTADAPDSIGKCANVPWRLKMLQDEEVVAREQEIPR
jgi:hypothetical protein